jgi:hypothetical protein
MRDSTSGAMIKGQLFDTDRTRPQEPTVQSVDRRRIVVTSIVLYQNAKAAWTLCQLHAQVLKARNVVAAVAMHGCL